MSQTPTKDTQLSSLLIGSDTAPPELSDHHNVVEDSTAERSVIQIAGTTGTGSNADTSRAPTPVPPSDPIIDVLLPGNASSSVSSSSSVKPHRRAPQEGAIHQTPLGSLRDGFVLGPKSIHDDDAALAGGGTLSTVAGAESTPPKAKEVTSTSRPPARIPTDDDDEGHVGDLSISGLQSPYDSARPAAPMEHMQRFPRPALGLDQQSQATLSNPPSMFELVHGGFELISVDTETDDRGPENRHQPPNARRRPSVRTAKKARTRRRHGSDELDIDALLGSESDASLLGDSDDSEVESLISGAALSRGSSTTPGTTDTGASGYSTGDSSDTAEPGSVATTLLDDAIANTNGPKRHRRHDATHRRGSDKRRSHVKASSSTRRPEGQSSTSIENPDVPGVFRTNGSSVVQEPSGEMDPSSDQFLDDAQNALPEEPSSQTLLWANVHFVRPFTIDQATAVELVAHHATLMAQLAGKPAKVEGTADGKSAEVGHNSTDRCHTSIQESLPKAEPVMEDVEDTAGSFKMRSVLESSEPSEQGHPSAARHASNAPRSTTFPKRALLATEFDASVPSQVSGRPSFDAEARASGLFAVAPENRASSVLSLSGGAGGDATAAEFVAGDVSAEPAASVDPSTRHTTNTSKDTSALQSADPPGSLQSKTAGSSQSPLLVSNSSPPVGGLTWKGSVAMDGETAVPAASRLHTSQVDLEASRVEIEMAAAFKARMLLLRRTLLLTTGDTLVDREFDRFYFRSLQPCAVALVFTIGLAVMTATGTMHLRHQGPGSTGSRFFMAFEIICILLLFTFLLMDASVHFIAPLTGTCARVRYHCGVAIGAVLAAATSWHLFTAATTCTDAVHWIDVTGPQRMIENCVMEIDIVAATVVPVGFAVLGLTPVWVLTLGSVQVIAYYGGRLAHSHDVEPTRTIVAKALISIVSLLGCVGVATVRARSAVAAFDTVVHLLRRAQEAERAAEELDTLLCTLVPEPVLPRLMATSTQGGVADNVVDRSNSASMLFADMQGFTAWSAARTPEQVGGMLNAIVGELDALAWDNPAVEKVKTVGDAYWAIAGLPEHHDGHADWMVEFGLRLTHVVKALNVENTDWGNVAWRVGVHSGPMCGAIFGTRQVSYEVFGAACKVSHKVEHHAVAGSLCLTRNVLAAFKTLPCDDEHVRPVTKFLTHDEKEWEVLEYVVPLHTVTALLGSADLEEQRQLESNFANGQHSATLARPVGLTLTRTLSGWQPPIRTNTEESPVPTGATTPVPHLDSMASPIGEGGSMITLIKVEQTAEAPGDALHSSRGTPRQPRPMVLRRPDVPHTPSGGLFGDVVAELEGSALLDDLGGGRRHGHGRSTTGHADDSVRVGEESGVSPDSRKHPVRKGVAVAKANVRAFIRGRVARQRMQRAQKSDVSSTDMTSSSSFSRQASQTPRQSRSPTHSLASLAESSTTTTTTTQGRTNSSRSPVPVVPTSNGGAKQPRGRTTQRSVPPLGDATLPPTIPRAQDPPSGYVSVPATPLSAFSSSDTGSATGRRGLPSLVFSDKDSVSSLNRTSVTSVTSSATPPSVIAARSVRASVAPSKREHRSDDEAPRLTRRSGDLSVNRPVNPFAGPPKPGRGKSTSMTSYPTNSVIAPPPESTTDDQAGTSRGEDASPVAPTPGQNTISDDAEDEAAAAEAMLWRRRFPKIPLLLAFGDADVETEYAAFAASASRALGLAGAMATAAFTIVCGLSFAIQSDPCASAAGIVVLLLSLAASVTSALVGLAHSVREMRRATKEQRHEQRRVAAGKWKPMARDTKAMMFSSRKRTWKDNAFTYSAFAFSCLGAVLAVVSVGLTNGADCVVGMNPSFAAPITASFLSGWVGVFTWLPMTAIAATATILPATIFTAFNSHTATLSVIALGMTLFAIGFVSFAVEQLLRRRFIEQSLTERYTAHFAELQHDRHVVLEAVVPQHVIPDLMEWFARDLDPARPIAKRFDSVVVMFVLLRPFDASAACRSVRVRPVGPRNPSQSLSIGAPGLGVLHSPLKIPSGVFTSGGRRVVDAPPATTTAAAAATTATAVPAPAAAGTDSDRSGDCIPSASVNTQAAESKFRRRDADPLDPNGSPAAAPPVVGFRGSSAQEKKRSSPRNSKQNTPRSSPRVPVPFAPVSELDRSPTSTPRHGVRSVVSSATSPFDGLLGTSSGTGNEQEHVADVLDEDGVWLPAAHAAVDAELGRLRFLGALDKIKSVGDVVVLAGPFTSSAKDHEAADAAIAATVLLGAAANVQVGLHVGPVLGAVQGSSRLSFDIFGDTVNTASRVMSGAQRGSVSASTPFLRCLIDGPKEGRYFARPGAVVWGEATSRAAKGKGMIQVRGMLKKPSLEYVRYALEKIKLKKTIAAVGGAKGGRGAKAGTTRARKKSRITRTRR